MTQLLLFNAARLTAEQLRDEGIERASDNAGADWKSQALHLLRMFLIESPLAEFQTEDVRHYATKHGLAAPPSERAWGSVIIAAKTLGLIAWRRYEAVDNPKAHRTPASVWGKK